ncbi:MAG: TIGR02281 family clan AA aspartic protease, partial [Acaryochloridaceae cyanobacterium CSU_5_19]|nr:TIGR02281 family clan AA aspartic protease [Acaryochloridaceae cyanobacterium CSU_5_19]
MKGSLTALLFSFCIVLSPLAGAAQTNIATLNQQLQQAVQRQNWSQAMQVIDQLIKAAPEQATQLRSYRQQLQQLHQSNSQGNPKQHSVQPSLTSPSQVGQVAIKRRSGGVAVIDVKFNNRRSFEMLVDSGASRT